MDALLKVIGYGGCAQNQNKPTAEKNFIIPHGQHLLCQTKRLIDKNSVQ
jgi:hypothetical protein